MQLHAQISELQSLAVKDETSIVELLRQALIVSAKVKDGDFKAWIESEMKGYGDKTRSEIPQYRHLAADMKTFNPVNGVLMPMHFQDASLARDLSVIQAKNGIAEIEQFSKETGGKCYVEFPPEFIAQFNAQSDLHAQFQPLRYVSTGAMGSIVSAVRNHVLQWTIRMQADAIEVPEPTAREAKKAKVPPALKELHLHWWKTIIGGIGTAMAGGLLWLGKLLLQHWHWMK